MKTILSCLYAFLIAVAVCAEPRTWTFCESSKITFKNNGEISFSKGGRIEADFIHSDATNVFLYVLYGGYGSVPLTNLSEADHAYVTKVKDTPVDEIRLAHEAQAREINSRLKEEAMARKVKEKQAVEALQFAKKQQEQKLEEANADARLAKFKPLLDGKSSPQTWQYYRARKAVEQVAAARDPTYGNYARQILNLTDKITNARLHGFLNVAESDAMEIKILLNLLLDAGVLQ